jgi:hypothetical protein
MQENLGRWLRQHGFGLMPVPHLKLTATLESDHNGIARLSILGQGSVQLGQTLETRKLVKNEPCVAHGGVAWFIKRSTSVSSYKLVRGNSRS